MDLEFEPTSEFAEQKGTDRSPTPQRRVKTSLRLKYEAEVQVIERKLGDLEAIREKLGLNQRKISQLLLVDPSAWTRWTKGPDQAPPHIYRMLQWYLALEEKYPVLDVNFWLNTVAQPRDFGPKSSLVVSQLDRRTTDLQTELLAARVRIEGLERAQAQDQRQAQARGKTITAFVLTSALLGLVLGFALARFI